MNALPKPTDDERYLQDDYRRRRVPVSSAKKMGDVVGQLLVKRGYGNVQQAQSLQQLWQGVAGEQYKVNTKAAQVKRGVLEVLVANSAVMQELTFVKAKLVKALAQAAAEQNIQNIRFKVGSVQ
jgi:predicted nucleic acid-binding Zn ribbon protein